jgi:PAS domain S-box-containing protein
MHPSLLSSARGEFGEHRDYSGRRQLKQQSDARYQALLNSDSTGIYSCDATGLITYFNKQAAELWGRQPILGDTAERFCGSLMLFRLDGRYLPHDQSPMADVLAGKVAGIYDAEVHIQRPDGSRLVVIVNVAPLIDDNGIVAGAFCSFCENPLRKRLKK